MTDKTFNKTFVSFVLTLLVTVNYFIDFSNFVLLLFFIFSVLFFWNGRAVLGIVSVFLYLYFFKTYVEGGTGVEFFVAFVFLNLFLIAVLFLIFKKILEKIKIDTDYAVFFSLFFINLAYVLNPAVFFEGYYFLVNVLKAV